VNADPEITLRLPLSLVRVIHSQLLLAPYCIVVDAIAAIVAQADPQILAVDQPAAGESGTDAAPARSVN